MSESFTTASIEFFRDFVKAAIDAIPAYHTILGGRWKGTSIVSVSPKNAEQSERRDISMSLRTNSGAKVFAHGVITMVDSEWTKGRVTIRIPVNNPSYWKFEGHLNHEGNFEFSAPRQLA